MAAPTLQIRKKLSKRLDPEAIKKATKYRKPYIPGVSKRRDRRPEIWIDGRTLADVNKLIYKTKEALQAGINQYFKEIKKDRRPPTMSGLAFALGVDRHTLLNYSKNEEFFSTIKHYRDRIASWTEEQLLSERKNVAGVIFCLTNNYGFKQKSESDVTMGSNPEKPLSLKVSFDDEITEATEMITGIQTSSETLPND